MQAIVLVGGLGTRLREVITDVPKPMAPIQDKPFLAYLLTYLKKQGITHIIFPVHFMGEKIESHFQSQYDGIAIQYVYEEHPLGTGGAIVNALSLLHDTTKPVFVLNGDTFVKLNYHVMYDRHLTDNVDLTMALRAVDDCSRYGKVVTEHNRIIEFREKGEHGPGLINAGVYLINPNVFAKFNMPRHFSVEKDFIFPYLSQLTPQPFMTNDYFIDIGIPEDYARAILELPELEK